MKPEDVANTENLDLYCQLSWLSRSKLSKREIKKLKAANMPEAAQYRYMLIEKTNKKADSQNEGSQDICESNLGQAVACYKPPLTIAS